MQIIQGTNTIVKSWIPLNEIEDTAYEQLLNMTELPQGIVFRHIAVMPDAHWGRGATVGTVLASKDYVLPNVVGMDIGCGMIASRFDDLTALKLEGKLDELQLRRLFDEICRLIPHGLGESHKEAQVEPWKDLIGVAGEPEHQDKSYLAAPKQLGTLGAGNHFIELQEDESGWLWFMIHSGSRNVGADIAKTYDKRAKKLHERWHTVTPPDLEYLPLEDDAGAEYMHDMLWAAQYAKMNRIHMMDFVQMAIQNVFGIEGELGDEVHVPHNVALRELHFNHYVIVHRKGATPAKAGKQGIIPGSRGHHSYIVKGLGERESFESCSHGAGRAMSRKNAKKSISEEEMRKAIEDFGALPFGVNSRQIDEAPQAYKDIEYVVGIQVGELIDIEHTLKPIFTIKG